VELPLDASDALEAGDPAAPAGRFPPVIGFARGAPAGVGTIGRAGAGTPGLFVGASGDALAGGADAGTAGFTVGIGCFTAATPSDVGLGVETPVGPVGIGDDARAGARTTPVGAIVCSTEGWAVVIEPLSSGISRSSARSRSSSSAGNSLAPFPPPNNSRDRECSVPVVRRAM
jgi:hypothetical protein